jgi:coenzyme F420-reducing hydrogenase alpha subunit
MPATTMLLAAVETADAALDAAFESAANIFRRVVCGGSVCGSV